MLRRKLLTRIGLLVGAFVAGAVVAIWLLQDVLVRIDRVNAQASVLVDGIQDVGAALTAIESARLSPQAPGSEAIEAAAARMTTALDRLGTNPIVQAPDGAGVEAYAAIRRITPAFLSQAANPRSATSPEALGTTVSLQAAVQDLARTFRSHVAAEQVALGRYFRALVLVLTLAALLMVNVAIFVLLRTAQMVLKPVGALVEGSRQLAAERFEHRVHVDQQDEFGELAHAYNHLAEQLMANEERKAETLRQLAVTLNHDLNNAMAAIELQLGLLGRQAGANPSLDQHLRQIRAMLARMTGTVTSLKHIRRIVLTDYAPGQKMLDLERSVADCSLPQPTPGHAA
jgi:nitrate/nitrite-specific signal transduction histidine kinase